MSSNTGNAPVEPAVTLDSVNIGMKSQKKQLLVLTALCALAVPCGLLALALLIASPEPEPAQDTFSLTEMRALQLQVTTLEASLATLAAASAQTQTEFTALSRQIGAMDVNDERNAIARVQELLVRQEQDYQQFLATLEGGLFNFHMMIPHSRGWWDAWQADLMESVEQNKSRQVLAASVLAIEPQGINQ